jgi:predicted small lipoprotein YifL
MKNIFPIVSLIIFITLTGCGTKLPDGIPKLYSVTVTVTQDGLPLENANVLLSGTDKWISTGTTNAQGIVSLYTQGKYPGVPEGTFKVSVAKIGEEGEKPPPRPFDAESERIYKEYQKSGKKYKQFNVIPEQYRKPETTPLQIEIKKGVKNVAVNIEGTVKDELRHKSGPTARP